MGTAQLVIAALGVSCLIALGAIIAVLRSDRRQVSAPEPAPPALPVGELAQRIRAAQPPQLRQRSDRHAASRQDTSSFGRMPDPVGPFERSDMGFAASGIWNASQPQRPPTMPEQVARDAWPGQNAPAQRLGSGPLVPIQGGSPLSPLPHLGSDPRGPGAYSAGTSGALGPGPSWLSPVASVSSGGLGSSSGRIPGFALDDALASVIRQMPRQLDAAEEQRLRDAAYVYDDGIRVAFDPQCDAVELVFAACPLRSEMDVALAFRILTDRFHALHGPMGRERAALLVDVAGLDIHADVTEAWVQALREFLVARCAQAGYGRFLLARYNSRARVAADRRDVLRQIQTATVTAALSGQTRIFGSRIEAVALIARLRELAAVPG